MPTVRAPLAIHLPRHAIGGATRLALLAPLLLACSEPAAPAAVRLSVTRFSATEGQTGQVGMALPAPLKVRVQSGGAPQEGVSVTWQAAAGSIDPSLGVTDTNGEAAAIWTLGEVPGPMTAIASVTEAEGSPLTFTATAVPSAPIATVVPASEGQSAVVGTTLPQPLRVLVQLRGAPAPGVRIVWHSSTGTVAPEESVTDGDGIASTTWTLGTVSGLEEATATIAGAADPPVTFTATGRADTGRFIEVLWGDGQQSPANHRGFSYLAVRVTDQYGNAAGGEAITWSVERGPVAFVYSDTTTDRAGQSRASVEPSGPAGNAVVRATLGSRTRSVSFALTVLPALYRVVVDDDVFRSYQNGSSHPAVDTIPLGATVEWLVDPFLYDVHRIVSTGSPSFPDMEIPYAAGLVRRKFDAPGTYDYIDFYYPTNHGRVVVR